MDLITQEKKIVNLLPHKDISAGAFSTAYVNMENYGHVDFIVSIGANGAGAKAVTFKESIAGSSSATLALPHYYSNATALGSASIANDTFAKVTMASGTFNIAASTDNLVYVIPCDADQLTSGKTHVGLGIATTSAACIAGCLAILSEPRYASDSPPSAL